MKRDRRDLTWAQVNIESSKTTLELAEGLGPERPYVELNCRVSSTIILIIIKIIFYYHHFPHYSIISFFPSFPCPIFLWGKVSDKVREKETTGLFSILSTAATHAVVSNPKNGNLRAHHHPNFFRLSNLRLQIFLQQISKKKSEQPGYFLQERWWTRRERKIGECKHGCMGRGCTYLSEIIE